MIARLEAPFIGGFAITPNDGVDLASVVRGIYVAVAGDVACVMSDGTTVTWTLAAGIPHPLRIKRVKATGTTATGITGGY